MISKKQVQHIHSLRLKKFREIHKQFLAEGSKLTLEILESRYKVISVFALESWLQQFGNILLSKKIPITEIREQEMEKITALSSPGPVLAIAEIPVTPVPSGDALDDLVLVLDDIKDPGNLGTIVRIADWFGIGQVICSEHTVDLYNPKVIQATMGSVVRVSVNYTSLPEFLSSLPQTMHIFGSFPGGDSIYSAQLPAKGIIIIGSESNGISPEIIAKITDRISIPHYSKKPNQDHTESLNASVATAIICSEFRRRTG